MVVDLYRQEVYQTSILRSDKKGKSEIYKLLEQFYDVAFRYEYENDEHDLMLVGEKRQDWENEKLFSINSKVSEEHWHWMGNPLKGVGVLIGRPFGGDNWIDVKPTIEDFAASITLH